MKALVCTCRDPFRPANHRSVSVVRRRKSLRNLAPRVSTPVICQVNGQWISRKAWARRVNDGDTVVFVALPHGGGGGSNPLKMILTLAVAIFAPMVAPIISSVTGLSVGLAQGIFGLVGSAIVNALIPAPKANTAQTASSLAAASPTYSIGAQGNQARIGQPIPVIYGRHLIYPDFGAMPYTEYAGNEQYLYQLFCVGQGYYDIEQIRIDDTPISSFPEITYQVVNPGGSVTLFPARVITSGEVSGQEALTSTTLGPFIANDSGTVTNKIAVDVVFSRGLYYATDTGKLNAVSCSWTVQAQQINDVGVAVGSWVTLGTETYSAATTTPQRRSYSYAVSDGRYQVRLTRTDTKQTDTRYGHELDWSGLRAYLPGSQSYGDVTMVAMRLRATNSLSSQASRTINMIVQRKLRTWHPVYGWSEPIATRSIAWAIADICQAEYGAGLPDSRIDLQGLYDLDQVWKSRGDYFDGIFDSQSTVMEALTQVSRAGRAVPYMQGGIVHAVRDSAATIPVAMFSQRNIVKGSFSIDYLMTSEDTADAVDVTYFDSQIWGERTVRATLPLGTSTKPASVKLFGVTSRQQAWNEGMYVAACNRYRRRIVTFQTEMEGFIPTIGDLLVVQHDMPKWGQSGEIVAWNTDTKEAVLSEPLDWSAGGPHVIAFRRRNGSTAGPYVAVAGSDAYHVTLFDWDAEVDPSPDVSADRERSHFAFGPANRQYIKCRMVTMRPKSSETVEIVAVVESDYVHTADTGDAPGVTAWQLPSKFTAPVILGLVAKSQIGASDKMLLTWQPAPGASYYIVEQSNDGIAWTRTGEPSSCNFTATALYGAATIIRVAAVGLTQGPWVQVAYGISADYMWTSDINAMWTADSNDMWRY